MATNKFTYQDYVESKKVKEAETALKNHNNTKPSEYTSQWQDKQNELLNKYQNRGPFSYDLASDTLYQQYVDRYSQLGKMAMQDTVGQAAAMTGGYGNSYAVTAGNQAYQNYLQGVNDVVPQLAEMAYNKYNQEGQDMLNLYGLYSDRENTDYSRWQDNMAYWESQRNYLADMYNNERNYDRDVYNSDRDFAYGTWSDDRDYNYQVERDKIADEQWQKQFDENKRQFNASLYASRASSSNNETTSDDEDDAKKVEYHNFNSVEDAAKYLADRDYKLPKDFEGFYSAYEWKRQKELGNVKSAFQYDSYYDYLSASVYYIESNQ